MKHRLNKLLALVLALAMLLSAFALADVDLEIDGEDNPNEVELEIEGAAQDAGAAQDDGLAIDEVALEGDSLESGNTELSLDLGLELDGQGLETLEGELAPVTEEAMNEGENYGTETNPWVIDNSDYSFLTNSFLSTTDNKRADGESADQPTYFKLYSDAIVTNGNKYIEVASGRHVVLDLNGHTIDRGLTTATSNGYVILV